MWLCVFVITIVMWPNITFSSVIFAVTPYWVNIWQIEWQFESEVTKIWIHPSLYNIASFNNLAILSIVQQCLNSLFVLNLSDPRCFNPSTKNDGNWNRLIFFTKHCQQKVKCLFYIVSLMVNLKDLKVSQTKQLFSFQVCGLQVGSGSRTGKE